jgi:hypothetical protein
MDWTKILAEAWRQCPAIALLGVAVYAFAHGSIVPSSAVTSVVSQCSEEKASRDHQIYVWQRLAGLGADVLQERAQSVAEIAPTKDNPSGPAKSVKIQAKPIAPDVKAKIEKPPTGTDATTIESRIKTADKVLQSAPVQVPVKPKPKA